MSRVLAAVDGSPVSVEVLRGGVVLADLLGARVEALYVGGEPAPDLQRLAAATGVRLTHRDGLAAQLLPRALREPDVVLGVVGTSGSGGTTVPAGQTAVAVMCASEKALLVVPPGSFPPQRRQLHRALVPLDGRPESAKAVEPVLRLLGEAGIDLVVVHVFDQATVPSFWDQPSHAAPSWEREFLHRNLPMQRTRLNLCQGDAADKLVQTANDEGADILVMGWSQDLSSGHARTLQELLATGGLPVLLLPVPNGAVVDLTEVARASPRMG